MALDGHCCASLSEAAFEMEWEGGSQGAPRVPLSLRIRPLPPFRNGGDCAHAVCCSSSRDELPAGMDFVGDLSNVLLESEVRAAQTGRLMIGAADRRKKTRPPDGPRAPFVASMHLARVPHTTQGEGERLAVGSPWVDGGRCEAAERELHLKQQQCAHCGAVGEVCPKCAIQVMHWTLSANFESYAAHVRRPPCARGERLGTHGQHRIR